MTTQTLRRKAAHRPRSDHSAGPSSTRAARVTRRVTTAPGDQPPTSSDLPKAPDVANAAADASATPSPTSGCRTGRPRRTGEIGRVLGADGAASRLPVAAATTDVPTRMRSAMTVLVAPADGSAPALPDVSIKTDYTHNSSDQRRQESTCFSPMPPRLPSPPPLLSSTLCPGRSPAPATPTA